jgi:competence protein ComEC
MRPPVVALWKQAPLIRFAIPLFAGIILQSACRFSENQLIVGSFLLILSYAGLLFLPLVLHFEKPYLAGIPLVLLCLAWGASLYYLNDVSRRSDWIGSYIKDQSVVLVSLKEPAIERAKTFKAEAAVEAVFQKGKWQNASGNLLLYFSKGTDEGMMCYGSRWVISSSLQPIKNAGNPGEFDYAGYAAKRNIYHSAFVSSETGCYLDRSRADGFIRFIHSSRASIVSIFKKYLSDEPEAAGLAEALVIGYKDDLDKELLTDYTKTGVVHVIAISGMHLALVYFVLEWLWKLIRLHHRKILSGILSIVILWVFSFLTGGSPSVLRSAIMFSFVILGRMINREGSVFNSLTASALFLAACDPFVLWDAGFLLSHLAVLGLITLQPPLAVLFQVKNKWIARISEMLILTSSAQLFTLPLCLYYFHQFPNYFLLSNLLIIPLSTIVLFGGILLILLSPFAGPAAAVGFCLSNLIFLMNAIAKTIGHWPGALTEDIYFGLEGLVLLFVFILLLSLWLIRKEFGLLKMALGAVLLFFIAGAFRDLDHDRRRLFVVYNVRGHSACDIILGDSYFFWGDSLFSCNLHIQDSVLAGSRKCLQANRRLASLDMNSYSSIHTGTFKVVLASGKGLASADLIIFNKDHDLYAVVPELPRSGKLIFDGSCRLWKIDNMRRWVDSLHLSCHPVPLEGAFSVNIPASNTSL